MYFGCLKMFADAARRHGLPLWITPLAVGHFRYRCPTEDLFRWQVNTAAAHGMTGFVWFFFYMRDPHDNYRVPPIDEHWERVETIAEALLKRGFEFDRRKILLSAPIKKIGTFHVVLHLFQDVEAEVVVEVEPEL